MVDTSVVIIRCNQDLPDPHHGVEVREESVGKIAMVEGQPYKDYLLDLYGFLGLALQKILARCIKYL